MTRFEQRVDDAIRRTETTGVSRIRSVPIDMIAAAVRDELVRMRPATVDDQALDVAIATIMQRNGFPTPQVLD